VNEQILEALSRFLRESSRDGLFPIIAYAIDNNRIALLTTNIPDLPLAMKVLTEATNQNYNLGYSLAIHLAQRAAEHNPHVFRLHEVVIEGLGGEERVDVGRVVSIFGAPFFEQKAFALVDICGFSRLSHPEQLSQLYSLTNVLGSSVRRVARFCARLGIRPSFGNTSTGDGFYLWHDYVGGNADTAVFMAMLCIMAQTEAMRRKGFAMRLRASYIIDSAFMIYGSDTPVSPLAVASNAVGAATNGAAGLISAARPSQILLGDFIRPGQPGEMMDPRVLLAQANELFREEGYGAATLSYRPDAQLRVTDKHGTPWYCWNLTGEVPNVIGTERTRERLGLEPDTAQNIAEVSFKVNT
jgi:class 3 adenylate cyclase